MLLSADDSSANCPYIIHISALSDGVTLVLLCQVRSQLGKHDLFIIFKNFKKGYLGCFNAYSPTDLKNSWLKLDYPSDSIRRFEHRAELHVRRPTPDKSRLHEQHGNRRCQKGR